MLLSQVNLVVFTQCKEDKKLTFLHALFANWIAFKISSCIIIASSNLSNNKKILEWKMMPSFFFHPSSFFYSCFWNTFSDTFLASSLAFSNSKRQSAGVFAVLSWINQTRRSTHHSSLLSLFARLFFVHFCTMVYAVFYSCC